MGVKGLAYLEGLLEQKERRLAENASSPRTDSNPRSPTRPTHNHAHSPIHPNPMIHAIYARGWRHSFQDSQIRDHTHSSTNICDSMRIAFYYLKERVPLFVWMLLSLVFGIFTHYLFNFSHIIENGTHEWDAFQGAWDRDWYELDSSMHVSIQLTEPLTNMDQKNNRLYPMDVFANTQRSSLSHSSMNADSWSNPWYETPSVVHSTWLSKSIQSASYDGFYAISRQIKLLYRCAQAHFCDVESSDYNNTAEWDYSNDQGYPNPPMIHTRLGKLNAASYRIQCPNTQVLRSFWQVYRTMLDNDVPILPDHTTHR